MSYLYVFIDVSGNYDFSNTGTKHLVLTSLLCTDIVPGTIELYALKHETIDQGIDIEQFHAAEDKQAVRDKVFDIISGLNHIRIDSVIVEKRKTDPSLRPLRIFYSMMIENLLKYPFDPRGIDVSRFDKVFIFLDRESGSGREELKKAVKLSLARHLGGIPYAICMHPSGTHPYLQMVDYCSWAIYVKWERREYRPHQKIANLVKSEFPIFAYGTVEHY
ncbi:MAG: DUF3800 domain-containing protein [Dehalococcoidia bacterium]|nr:DUF3800 domain-containing protein [Dehalococcoidia bacterium]